MKPNTIKKTTNKIIKLTEIRIPILLNPPFYEPPEKLYKKSFPFAESLILSSICQATRFFKTILFPLVPLHFLCKLAIHLAEHLRFVLVFSSFLVPSFSPCRASAAIYRLDK